MNKIDELTHMLSSNPSEARRKISSGGLRTNTMVLYQGKPIEQQTSMLLLFFTAIMNGSEDYQDTLPPEVAEVLATSPELVQVDRSPAIARQELKQLVVEKLKT